MSENTVEMYNISSSPHFRQDLTVSNVMMQVVISLMPATIFGIVRYGLHALLVIVLAVGAAVGSEYLFGLLVHKPNTYKDCSAIVTGLLLALSLPSTVPWYIPVLGSVFAMVVVKGCFGGLGKNFMNPALAARCFLLISFGTQMTNYVTDTVSGATPLAALKAGETINIADTYLGFSGGVIGSSALALIIGGLYLWIIGGITWHIPVAVLGSFSAFILIFGGHGLDIPYLIANIVGGGILMAAFFMATDPVTNPVSTSGQVIFGIIVGVIAGLFRLFGSSADSVSYAVIISNMFVPFIDKLPVRKPLGYRHGEYKEREFPKAAINLCVIAIVTGFALSAVYAITKDKIAEQDMQKNTASYQAVLSDATQFVYDDTIKAAVDALDGQNYDEASFGRTTINDVVVGEDDAGSTVGYVVSVTSSDGYDGDITLSVGITTDGTVTGIAFTELNETAGMGMRADEDEFKDQFKNVKTDAFNLIKSGNGTADNDIDSVSGASTTSGAVVNAVNTALAFYRDHIAA